MSSSGGATSKHLSKRKMFKKWENGELTVCAICGTQIHFPSTPVLGALTIDHVIPKVKGGKSMNNLQPAHKKCNSHKGASTKYVLTPQHLGRIKRAITLTEGKS